MINATNPEDPFFVFFRWGPRLETPIGIAKSTIRFLKGLSRIDPVFGKWTEWNSGFTREIPVSLTARGIQRVIERSNSRIGYRGRAIPDPFGYGFNLHTAGEDLEYCRVDLNIAGQGDNCCIVYPPYSGRSARRVWRPETIRKLCRWIVNCWSPESGEVTSGDTLNLVKEPNAYDPRPGWIMYRSSRQPSKEVPLPATAETIQEFGTLITTFPGDFNPRDKDHRTLLKKVFKAFHSKKQPLQR